MDNKGNILIVDDDMGICETLSDIMEDKGYRAFMASDGFEAVEKAREVAFDIILMDIRMPGINGVETFRMIKSFYRSEDNTNPFYAFYISTSTK